MGIQFDGINNEINSQTKIDFPGSIGIAGTLTYEDVTNVDSVGVITARLGVNSVGIITARLGVNLVGNDLNVGSNIKIGNTSGIVTATSFSGSGANLTGINTAFGSGTSINTSGIITATAFIPTTGQLSHRNIIINGAITVAQRMSSHSTGGQNLTGIKTVDRFGLDFGGTDNSPTQIPVDVASGTTPYTLGFRRAFKAINGNQTSGAGAGDYIRMAYKVEAQDMASSGWNYTSSSSDITLSFWVKSSVSQNFNYLLHTSDGTSRLFPSETGTLSANTWTKITKTIPGDSNLTFNNDNGIGLILHIYQFLGTNYTSSSVTNNQWQNYSGSEQTPDQTSTWYTTNDATFEITGVQLEVGSVATPFEHRSFTEELLRCMRYYEGVYMTDGTALMKSYASYGGSANFEYQFKVEKRTTPTFSLEGNASWSGATPNAFESRSACLFQHNGGTLFSLGDAHDDLCASFTAEL